MSIGEAPRAVRGEGANPARAGLPPGSSGQPDAPVQIHEASVNEGMEELPMPISDAPIEEIEAGYAFRQTMIQRADDASNLMWHGWVIMDAFLAGIQWERNRAHPRREPDSGYTEG